MGADDFFDAAVHKALGHPLRLRILESVLDLHETSPLAVSRRLGRPLGTVSRHMRVLRDLGFVELTRTEPRRGAVEHFYRAVQSALIDAGTWERLAVPLRRGLAGQTLRTIVTEAAEAGGRGGFDGGGAHLDRIPLRLDAPGRRELSAALDALLERALAIQAQADRRIADREDGGELDGDDPAGEESVLALLYFDLLSSTGREESTPPGAARPPPLARPGDRRRARRDPRDA